MSNFLCDPPAVDASTQGVVAACLQAGEKDLGGFSVRRLLPSPERQMVGPFIFFDHLGPADFPAGKGIDVRPHPHIGLATITYLLEGEILHRDSLGNVQQIRPGAVNLMTAGRGITHSERSSDSRPVDSRIHGLQLWIALPGDEVERAPAFEHTGKNALPEIEREGHSIRVIIGSYEERRSPVVTYSPTRYLEARLGAAATFELDGNAREQAVYVIEGAIEIDGQRFGQHQMIVLHQDVSVPIRGSEEAHIVVIGGDPLGERRLWWNFVATSSARIDQAKRDWREGRFGSIPGETEFIPLPD